MVVTKGMKDVYNIAENRVSVQNLRRDDCTETTQRRRVPVPLKQEEVLRNRYQIRERIGQGGMGSIYLANDLRLEGRLCAPKEVEYDRALPPRVMEEARPQFPREAPRR